MTPHPPDAAALDACDPRYAPLGARLVPTEEAIRCDVAKRGDKGTLRGFGRVPDMVRVQKDGNKTVVRYHYTFWQVSHD